MELYCLHSSCDWNPAYALNAHFKTFAFRSSHSDSTSNHPRDFHHPAYTANHGILLDQTLTHLYTRCVNLFIFFFIFSIFFVYFSFHHYQHRCRYHSSSSSCFFIIIVIFTFVVLISSIVVFYCLSFSQATFSLKAWRSLHCTVFCQNPPSSLRNISKDLSKGV
ncbi:hypothetical protein IE53DRAFT_364695 [Violaceomyces palustris]|uniref:Uncharacterized protein n=1 Tax=Violaceomyces palustris TaxID=1673888 RepID=A0ACD0NNQ0_9BASI|nr:hypothetical protein IE53DRAFT_364695 [Violaceomyces palustris]